MQLKNQNISLDVPYTAGRLVEAGSFIHKETGRNFSIQMCGNVLKKKTWVFKYINWANLVLLENCLKC